MKVMNEFWTYLGLCADDPVYRTDPRFLNELGDAAEFIVYGEERCELLGIADDEEKADFLSQAFDGKVRVWYEALPEHVQSNWFDLKIALLDEFDKGVVMEVLKKLCTEWLPIPNAKASFNTVWKVYERVSFFRNDFLACLHSKLLAKLDEVCLEFVKCQSTQRIDEVIEAIDEEMQCEEASCHASHESGSCLSYEDGIDMLSCFEVCKDVQDVDALLTANTEDICGISGRGY